MRLHVTISEQGSNEIISRIEQDELDAAIVLLTDNNKHKNIKAIKIMESAVVAVFPSTHQLAKKRYIMIKDLQDEKLIIPTGNFNLQRIILNRMEEMGIRYKKFFSCSQIETCFVLVSKGLGISFCSEAMIKNSKYENIAYVPMKEIENRKIYLVYSKNLEYHPALDKFVKFVENYYLGFSRSIAIIKSQSAYSSPRI